MKNFFFAIFFILPLITYAQAAGSFTWTDADNANSNWSNPANWDLNNGTYPGGNGAIVKIGKAGNTSAAIALDVDVSLQQMLINGNLPANSTFTITGNKTITFTGNSAPGGTNSGDVFKHTKKTGTFVFNCNVTNDSGVNGSNKVWKMNKNDGVEILTFGSGYTLTINQNMVFQFENKVDMVNFEGTVVSAANKELKLQNKFQATIAASSDWSGYLGYLMLSGGDASATGLTINGNVFAKRLNLANAAKVTIGTTGSVTLSASGDLACVTASTSGGITINTSRTSSGSLVAKGATNAAGENIKVTIARALDGGDEWALIGMGVQGVTVDDVDDNLRVGSGSYAGKSAIGYFDNDSNDGEFIYYATGATTALVNGKGYAISPDGAQTVNLSGNMNTTNFIQVGVTNTADTYGNWNLVGNPYPSYHKMTDDASGQTDATDNFLGDNDANLRTGYKAIYAWDGVTYDAYDHSTNTINYIAPGEGFFIHMRDNVASVNMNFRDKNQVTSGGLNFNASVARNDFKREAVFKIKMEDVENNEYDYVNLFFSDKTSRGYDSGYDSAKFGLGSKSKIFTSLVKQDEGEASELDYHNQSLSFNDLKDLVIPLGLKTNSRSLKISIRENTLDHLYNVYLEDRLKNTIVEFDKSIELDFDKPSEGLGRFYLHFTDGMIPELPTDGDDFRIYKVSNSEIRLMGTPETNYNAKVYDFSGRLIREVNFNHRININEIDSRGINILTIESNDKKLTKKFKLN